MPISKVIYNPPESSGGSSEVWMDVTNKTVTASTLLSGETALKNDGTNVVGTYVPLSINPNPQVVSPSTSTQNITPDSNYDGMSQVTVNAMQLVEKTVSPSAFKRIITPNSILKAIVNEESVFFTNGNNYWVSMYTWSDEPVIGETLHVHFYWDRTGYPYIYEFDGDIEWVGYENTSFTAQTGNSVTITLGQTYVETNRTKTNEDGDIQEYVLQIFRKEQDPGADYDGISQVTVDAIQLEEKEVTSSYDTIVVKPSSQKSVKIFQIDVSETLNPYIDNRQLTDNKKYFTNRTIVDNLISLEAGKTYSVFGVVKLASDRSGSVPYKTVTLNETFVYNGESKIFENTIYTTNDYPFLGIGIDNQGLFGVFSYSGTSAIVYEYRFKDTENPFTIYEEIPFDGMSQVTVYPAPPKTYTATITPNSTNIGSTAAYVAYQGTTYWKKDTTFEFIPGQNLLIHLNYTTSTYDNLILLNGRLKACGRWPEATEYNYILPSENITIRFYTGINRIYAEICSEKEENNSSDFLLIDRTTLTSFESSAYFNIGRYAFAGMSSLSYVSFQNCKYIGSSAFRDSYLLKTAYFPECISIQASAFATCSALSSIYFPKVSSIGQGAFTGCGSLTEAIFPSALSISAYAFSGCNKLQTISFPECKYIGVNAFAYCSSISEAIFPNVSYIGSAAFISNSGLTLISFPSCTVISQAAFSGCHQLTEVEFPACESIGASAFSGCSGLISASFSNCTSISNAAFSGCSLLNNLYCPKVETINSSAFMFCSSLQSAAFSLVVTLNGYTFSSCSALISVSFPACENIGGYAFTNCTSLENVFFPEATIVSQGAFNNCRALSTVSFPKCSAIWTLAFTSCWRLLSVYLLGSSVVNLSTSTAFSSTPISRFTDWTSGVYGNIYVPSSLYSIYISATNWTLFSSRFVSV